MTGDSVVCFFLQIFQSNFFVTFVRVDVSWKSNEFPFAECTSDEPGQGQAVGFFLTLLSCVLSWDWWRIRITWLQITSEAAESWKGRINMHSDFYFFGEVISQMMVTQNVCEEKD
jgi:hypothetical protein